MPRRCKHCREYNIPKDAPKTESFCSVDHKIMYALAQVYKARVKVQKAVKKEQVLRKRAFYAEDVKTRREAAILWFNKYILLRDRGRACITCNTTKPGLSYHAGHYINAGTCTALRFDERNVWKQCARCNLFLSGAKAEYRVALCDRIGTSVVEMLDGPQPVIKITAEWYQSIENRYKQLCKEMEMKSA